MKVTIEKKEEIEVDIELPYYSFKLGYYFKVTEFNTITLFDFGEEISIANNGFMMKYPLTYQKITEQEFNLKFQEIKNKINNL